MKRIFILFAVMMMAVGLSADEAILIDFSKLNADIIQLVEGIDSNGDPILAVDEKGDPIYTQNRATIMDYGAVAGGSFTTEQKRMMKTSLAIRNWTVRLNSSARTVVREVLTYADEAESKLFGTVMGVRISFPTEPWNAHAFIRPPFEIPAFEAAGNINDQGRITPTSSGVTSISRFEGPVEDGSKKPAFAYGVVKNVGTIKSVQVAVYGLQFPHSISVILIDNEGNEHIYHVDYLNYDGWAELSWSNPAYVQQVRNREIKLNPLYPTSTPFVKFGGFLIKRDADKAGGDFICYFKDVKIIYDKAVLDTDRDIDDEGLWHIIRDREILKKKWEMSRFGQQQILRYLELQKQATESSFSPYPKED